MHPTRWLYDERMAVSLRHLRALLAVVEEGTFTDAAIALRTSQASVSRAVADLETALGVRVLQRTSTGALPTVDGRRVAEHARRILAEIAALEQIGGTAPPVLRVGFTWSVFGRLTVPIQRAWQAGHPDGTLAYVHSESPTAGLIEGETDIGVVRTGLQDSRFEWSLVGTEARVAALSVEDPLARRRVLRLSDLAERTIAMSTTTGTTTAALWPDNAAMRFVEIHGIEEWLTAVGSGTSVGITPQATADQFPRPGLRFIPIRDAPPVAVRLAWWRENPPPGALAFRQLVCEHYAGRASRVAGTVSAGDDP